MANHDDGLRPAWQPYPARRLMADEVREFRVILGLTQAGLAGVLGVSLRAVEEWEGSRNPVPTYLQLALERLVTLKTTADRTTRREIEAGRVGLTVDEAAGMALRSRTAPPG
jgi:transcriptional regulator with XRE-family HTH domain